jgi:hypothetical protein
MTMMAVIMIVDIKSIRNPHIHILLNVNGTDFPKRGTMDDTDLRVVFRPSFSTMKAFNVLVVLLFSLLFPTDGLPMVLALRVVGDTLLLDDHSNPMAIIRISNQRPIRTARTRRPWSVNELHHCRQNDEILQHYRNNYMAAFERSSQRYR